MCKLEDLIVDATVHGNVIEITSFDGEGKEFIAAEFRQPSIDSIFCGGCGEYLFEDGVPSEGVNSIVSQHLAKVTA